MSEVAPVTATGLEARLPSDTAPRRRVVGLVDTDSFAKWGAHLLGSAPAQWDLELITVATPRSASPAQLRSAFRGLTGRLAAVAAAPPAPRSVDAIVDRLRAEPPDAVLVSLIGPVAELVIDQVHRTVPNRPVLVTGLPGISFPAKWKGVFLRARADLFVLHSHREIRAYEELTIAGGLTPNYALATLPFAGSPDPERAKTHPTPPASPPNPPAHSHAGLPAHAHAVSSEPERAKTHAVPSGSPPDPPAHAHAGSPDPERAKTHPAPPASPPDPPAHAHTGTPHPERAKTHPTPPASPPDPPAHAHAGSPEPERAKTHAVPPAPPPDPPAHAHTDGITGTGATGRPRDSVVFAAQPSVPPDPLDRQRIVHWLAETARAHPEWRVVIKTRAAAGEHQTHREQHPYPDLVPADSPANLVVETGPMAEHLERAVALVTVSSTAVLEAVAAGVPALTLTDFGTSRQLINEVFVGSGLEGTSDDLVAGRFGTVRSEWLHDNHFHPLAENDWAARTEALMAARADGQLTDRPAARRSRGGALRRAWERKNALGRDDRSALGIVALVIGAPVRRAKRVVRKVIRASRPTQRPGGLERLRDRDQQLVARRDAG